MPARLYFDLATVAQLAVHAVLADRTIPTCGEIADNIEPRPALWFYRSAGRAWLCSNGVVTSHDVAMGRQFAVAAHRTDALTTPCVQPPDRKHPAVFALLRPEHRPLIDVIRTALADGATSLGIDPLTNTLAVGRRRQRQHRAAKHPNIV